MPFDPARTLLVFDIDGVIQFDRRVHADAVRLVERLRRAGFALRFLTNDGYNSRQSRLAGMHAEGFMVAPHELYTSSYLAARYAASRGPTYVLTSELAAAEYEGLEQDHTRAKTVIIGDWFDHYDRERLQRAFEAALRGAEMVAVHKKRAWTHEGRRLIDVGFWVAGLEHCTGRPATVVGKPGTYAYESVLQDTGYAPADTVMISDEPDPDLLGAASFGMHTLWYGGAHEPVHPQFGRALSYDEIARALLS